MKRNVIVIIVVIILVVVTWVVISSLNSKPKVEDTTDIKTIEDQKTVASKGIEKEKKIGKLVITDGNLSTTTGITTLDFTVTNKGTDNSDVKLQVTILDPNGSVIFTGEKDIGLITPGQIKKLNMKINKEIKNAFDIEYVVQ